MVPIQDMQHWNEMTSEIFTKLIHFSDFFHFSIDVLGGNFRQILEDITFFISWITAPYSFHVIKLQIEDAMKTVVLKSKLIGYPREISTLVSTLNVGECVLQFNDYDIWVPWVR